MPYAIELTSAARRQLAKLSAPARALVGEAISALAQDPRPPQAKPLVNQPSLWRVRAGEHRVLYQVREQTLLVLVVKVGHRREVYRGLSRL